MTFYVGSSFQKKFELLDVDKNPLDFTEYTELKSYWTFEFADGTRASITGQEPAANTIAFNVLESFFRDQHVGPITWQIILTDTDNNPIYYSSTPSDMVEKPIFKKSELS